VFTIWSVDECLEGVDLVWSATKAANSGETVPHLEDHTDTDPVKDQLDTLAVGEDYWGTCNPAPNLHIEMDPAFITDLVKGYKADPALRLIWNNEARDSWNWKNNGCFLRDEHRLLFFLDEDY